MYQIWLKRVKFLTLYFAEYLFRIMEKIRLSVISYLNTKPFLYGINNSEFIKENSEIEMDFPSACAEKVMSGKTDIGIVPVALLSKLEKYRIISDYCISTDRKMPSVLLSSQVPLEKIKKVLLDNQSMTSVNLTKILIEKFWKISPETVDANEGYENLCRNALQSLRLSQRPIGSFAPG